MTLKQISDKNRKKIPIEMGGILEALEKALTEANEKAVEEFRAEAEEVKNKTLSELADKVAQAEMYVQNLKPEKGDPGEKPTREELLKLMKPLIPVVKDGHTPTKEELHSLMQEMMSKMPNMHDHKNMPTVDEIVSSVTEKLPELIKEHAPKLVAPTVRRSKAYLKFTPLTGTIDGSNKKFYMSEEPKYGTQVFVIANSQSLEINTDFTVSGNWISYSEAPYHAAGFTWRHFAILFRP